MNTQSELLLSACYNGDVARVRRFLLEGFDPNSADQWRRTALTFAAMNGHTEVVRLLINHGAWLDFHEDYDTAPTPLAEAAQQGHFEIVKMLVEAGANPFLHTGTAQRTPESYARDGGHAEIAEYLSKLPRR